MSCVFIISAPSGSGKSTLVNNLLRREPNLLFSVSYTTRDPRGQERDGAQYRFVSREQFEAMIARDEFLEFAQVFGNYYGTHREVVERGQAEGRDVILDIDVQGARQLRRKIPDAISIFILAPSREELAKRLRARSEDSEETIARRLAGAAKEIEDFAQYDYVLVNEDVATASDLLHAIIQAERLRRRSPRVTARVEKILASFAAQPANGQTEQ
ncbi:MAG: guanylate kinase [Bryobacteraceae bacterium]|nr:guanylate kinase [Bryobacteraceae bacterium]